MVPLAAAGHPAVSLPGIDRHTPVADLPELVRPREFQAWSGCSRSHIYHSLRTGELPHCRIGCRIFIPKSAIEEWLANGN